VGKKEKGQLKRGLHGEKKIYEKHLGAGYHFNGHTTRRGSAEMGHEDLGTENKPTGASGSLINPAKH